MNIGRFLVYVIGLVLVVGALWWIAGILGLFEVVSSTLVIAVLVLILGLGVMGAAMAARDGEEHHHHHRERV